MKRSIIIVAGGKGTRMGNSTPKQFLLVNKVPIIVHTIRAFEKKVDECILVLPEQHRSDWTEMADRFGLQEVISVTGGKERADSVLNGLGAASGELVAVHDGVRPFVSSALIDACFEGAETHGAAIPVVAISSSVRKLEGDKNKAVDRSSLRAVQTPQVFRKSILQEAFQQAPELRATDEATLVESGGTEIHLIEGEVSNIKITTPFDLKLAESILG